MVVIGIIGAVALAVWAVVVADLSSRREGGQEAEVDHRAERYWLLAETAERLYEELGREPSVREIYAAIEPERDGRREDSSSVEEGDGPVIDLRARVERITEPAPDPSVA